MESSEMGRSIGLAGAAQFDAERVAVRALDRGIRCRMAPQLSLNEGLDFDQWFNYAAMRNSDV